MMSALNDPGRPGPWEQPCGGGLEIRIRAPRSGLPVHGRYLLIAAALAATLVSLRFFLLGAWPVLIFSVLDLGALAAALYIFRRGPVPEERLRIVDGHVELERLDGRGRRSRVRLPAFWTRLEASGRTDLDCDLWLVFRRERHPVGLCVSAAERRALLPRIAAVLGAGRR